SSGQRINSAGDDAAGLALSNNFTSDIRGLEQARRNAQDAEAMLAVAEGGVRTIAKNLMRAHELGTQAGNDTYSYAERRLIRQEIAAIWKEIDRVAQSTTFNGIEMLTLSAPKKLLIQVGSGNDTSTGSVDVLNIASAFGALTNFTLHLGTAGVPNNAAANFLTSRVETALLTVNDQLARLGALQNRLQGVVENIDISVQNLSSARSRIQDADMASETANLTKHQLIQQSTLSVLAQANLSPQGALRLLSATQPVEFPKSH
ncbi:MAG: flagellin FliC, partial [Cyanobacteria bacterium HKST-UBA03]|nr:flagellin FliC [Cyanobacteria bacterium HKST-UBA03]